MTDYAAVAKENHDLFKELLHSTDGWATVREDDGVTLEAKPREGSNIDCYRVTGQVPRTPKDAADFLWGWGKAEFQKVSSDVQECEIVTNVDDKPDQRIVYQRTALPWPLWHRDVCLFNWRCEEDGAYYVLYKSVTHEKVPEKPSDYVRATVLIGGYVFTSVEGSDNAKVVRIIHLEPNGSIPSAVVNMKANELHKQMQAFQALF